MDAMMKVMGDMQKQIEKAQKEQIAEQRELRRLIARQQSGVLRDLKGAGAADADPRVQMWELIMKATSLPNGKPESWRKSSSAIMLFIIAMGDSQGLVKIKIIWEGTCQQDH